jgi:RNA polymerase sigma-70 factor (ECF subfamily)
MNPTIPSTPSAAIDLDQRFAQHRPDLTGFCYRMLGSAFDADDAVQETLVRAWRGLDRFEGRASLRTWLHRIAANVCLDMLEHRARRARPMEIGPATSPEGPVPDPLDEATWILPIPDDRVLGASLDPQEILATRESIRLAFVAALQRLPPRQRAVLLLRELLAWEAAEIAELLDTSVASVNSALQRARATLGADEVKCDTYAPLDEKQRALLGRYVEAFERFDVDALVSLLHEDATMSMPPYPLWLRGRETIRAWLSGLGSGCRGSRLVPLIANGAPAFAQYRSTGPWAIQVLEIAGGEIVAINSFMDTPKLFPLFGVPPHVPT